MSRGLPAALASELEAALERALGRPTRIARSEPVHGGCVNPSACIVAEGGARFFVKWNPAGPTGLFEAEADGLAALAAARALRVPEVIAVGGLGCEPGAGTAPPWLLLEWVERGRPAHDYPARLGAGLADLHRAGDTGGSAGGWGWERDNFIGPLHQANAPTPGWAEFWRDRRLAPQLALARALGRLAERGARVVDEVVERTPDLLADVDDAPSLLHGDLWGGNVFPDSDGRPVLIDPAVQRGHREVDLAMSELFGGFPEGWPGPYWDARPPADGYAERRRPLYQLYYLLVHVNLFGGGYEGACLSAAGHALAGA